MVPYSYAKQVKVHSLDVTANIGNSFSSPTSDYVKLSFAERLDLRLGYEKYAERCSGEFFQGNRSEYK